MRHPFHKSMGSDTHASNMTCLIDVGPFAARRLLIGTVGRKYILDVLPGPVDVKLSSQLSAGPHVV